MRCFDCPQDRSSEAIGLCHHCSAALCREHAVSIPEDLYANEAVARTVALPRRARLLLCRTCKDAFEQQGAHALAAVS